MAGAAPSPWTITRGGLSLNVRLTPRSSVDRIDSVEERGGKVALKARVRAVPEDGAANSAIEVLVADWLGLPKRDVTLTSGGKSRDKVLSIAGNAGVIEDVLKLKLAALGMEETKRR